VEKKRAKSWQLFWLFVFMGILAGLFSIICQSISPNEKLRTISELNAFFLGFGPSLTFFLVSWLAIGTSTHKDCLPI